MLIKYKKKVAGKIADYYRIVFLFKTSYKYRIYTYITKIEKKKKM